MKKLFTLFVAMTAVYSLSAKTVYLQANDDWKSFDAVLFVHSWGAEEADAQLALVPEHDHLFSAEIPDGNNNLCFVRMKDGSDKIIWDGDGKYWTKTGDLEIPEGKDCFWLIGGENGTWVKNGELPKVVLVGNFEGDASWAPLDKNILVPAEDKKSASLTVESLAKNNYEMKIWVDGFYLSLNGETIEEVVTNYRIHRDWNHADNVNMVNDGKNFVLDADETGNYIFTWTFASQNLVVTFPATTPTDVINAGADIKVVKRIVNGQLVIEKNGVRYNTLGAEIR